MNKMKTQLVTIASTLMISLPAAAQLQLQSTNITPLDNGLNLAVRALQAIFFVGGFAYVGFSGLNKAKGGMDANDRMKDAFIGAGVAIGAPLLMEVLKTQVLTG